MTNLEIINHLKKSTFTDEDGVDYQLSFYAGLTDTEIDTLRKKFPNEGIDEELMEILKATKGWDGYGPDMIYFDSIGQFFHQELSPNCITLGHDGFGNYWILDIDQEGHLGKIFYACHDPAVFVIHSQSLNEYLHHLMEFYENPIQSHLDEIHEKTVMTLWDDNPYCSVKSDFLNNNPEYQEFLSSFTDEEWVVADLRSGENKAGFAWGRFGSDQFTKRHPKDLIWVMKQRKKGFLSRLLGI